MTNLSVVVVKFKISVMGATVEDTKWLVREWISNVDSMCKTFKTQGEEVTYHLNQASKIRIVFMKMLEYEITEHLDNQLYEELSCINSARAIFTGVLETIENAALNESELQELNNFVLDTAEELYCQIVKTKLHFVQKFWDMLQMESYELQKAKLELSHIVLLLIDNVEDVEEAAQIIMTQFVPTVQGISSINGQEPEMLISFKHDSC